MFAEAFITPLLFVDFPSIMGVYTLGAYEERDSLFGDDVAKGEKVQISTIEINDYTAYLSHIFDYTAYHTYGNTSWISTL